MRAGIVVDDWKLAVFRRRLEEAGYSYEDKGEFRPNITLLHVEFTDQEHLTRVLEEATDECNRQRGSR